MKEIEYKVPENCPDESKKIFFRLLNTIEKEPEIKIIQNVFVSYEGLVLKNGFLIDKCAFNLKGKEDYTFYTSFWKLTLEQYLVSKFGKSLPSIHLKKPNSYLLIHTKWFNYSFWITSSLVRLFQAYKEGHLNNVKLLIPESYKRFHFVEESLSLFPVEKYFIPKGVHLFVDNLVLPETRKWSAKFYAPNMRKTSNFIVGEVSKDYISNSNLKIYISRAKRGVRSIINEVELVNYLKQKEFQIIYAEKLSFKEQVQLMQKTKLLLAPHGAGLANIMFLKKGNHVIEMIDEDFAKFKNPMPFWNLANAMGVKYEAFFTKTSLENKLKRTKESDEEWRMKLVNTPMQIDIKKLDKLINKIEII